MRGAGSRDRIQPPRVEDANFDGRGHIEDDGRSGLAAQGGLARSAPIGSRPLRESPAVAPARSGLLWKGRLRWCFSMDIGTSRHAVVRVRLPYCGGPSPVWPWRCLLSTRVIWCVGAPLGSVGQLIILFGNFLHALCLRVAQLACNDPRFLRASPPVFRLVDEGVPRHVRPPTDSFFSGW